MPQEQVTNRAAKTDNGIAFDRNGAILLAVSVALVVGYYVYTILHKKRMTRGKMDTVAAGMLRLAAARGDIRKLELLSTIRHFNVDADLMGFTSLHAASVNGHADAVVWLCQKGANVHSLKRDGWMDTALHYAASRGHLECVKALLAYGADINASNYSGSTPYDLAVRAHRSSVAAYLKSIMSKQSPLPSREAFDSITFGLQYPLAGSTSDSANTPSITGNTSANQTKAPHVSATTTSGPKQASDAPPSPPSPPPATFTGQQISQLAKTEPGLRDELSWARARGWEGIGSPGTEARFTLPAFRVLAVATQLSAVIYLVWRAARSLTPGYGYFYSMPFWLAEFSAFVLSNCFVLSLWNQIERPQRLVRDMMSAEEMPTVDVYIVCYSEPVDVIEPTAIAALNMAWPGRKLSVYILDDGGSEEVAKMVKRLQYQCQYMGREAQLHYVCRRKVKGVPHHAKAGNINSCLLKEAPGAGDFVLVLDCDMIVHPDFLQRVVGHFYVQRGGVWVAKEKAALMQTPQDFWNVDAADTMVHCARFFYGPMLQGRDGIGACPCCGTGVVFRRDILVSIGGQAYGSITEDYNTAMTLMSAGFATMFLNERLVFGMVPEDIEGVLKQRLRWAMGALQILMNDNPLKLPGLTTAQALLFFEAAAHHYLAIPTIMMALVPLAFLFTEYSPLVCPHLWEFCVIFGNFYTLNRIMMWWSHRGTEGGDQEMWRGSQMWVWMAPNHIKAMYKVLLAESTIFKMLCKLEITFAVTSKEKVEESTWDVLVKGLVNTWPYLAYLAGYVLSTSWFIANLALGRYSRWEVVIFVSALLWGALIVLCIWPPIATLIPRQETDEGWRIMWNPFQQAPARPGGQPQPAREGLFSRLTNIMSNRSNILSGSNLGGGYLSGTHAAPPPPPQLPPAMDTIIHATWQGGMLLTGIPENDIVSAVNVVVDGADDEQLLQSMAGSMVLSQQSAAVLSGPGFAASARHMAASGTPGGAPGIPLVHSTRPGSVIATTGANTFASNIEHDDSTTQSSVLSNVGRVALRKRTSRAMLSSALLTSVVLPERDTGTGTGTGTTASLLVNAQGIHPARGAREQVEGAMDILQQGGRPAAVSGRAGQGFGISFVVQRPAPAVAADAAEPAATNDPTVPGSPPPAAAAAAVSAQQGEQSTESDKQKQQQQQQEGEGGSKELAAVAPAAAPLLPPARLLLGPQARRLSAASATSDVSISSVALEDMDITPWNQADQHAGVTSPPDLKTGVIWDTQLSDAARQPAQLPRSPLDLYSELALSGPAGFVSRSMAVLSSRANFVSHKLMASLASHTTGGTGTTSAASFKVVPVDPANIYEYSLLARPNFDNRELPRMSWMFVLVNAGMLAALAFGAWLDLELQDTSTDVSY